MGFFTTCEQLASTSEHVCSPKISLFASRNYFNMRRLAFALGFIYRKRFVPDTALSSAPCCSQTFLLTTKSSDPFSYCSNESSFLTIEK